MKQELAQIALVVKDYDEAIVFYTRRLGFTLIEDTILSDTKRWVVIAPPGSTGCRLLLAKAANEEQASRIGNQTGGRTIRLGKEERCFSGIQCVLFAPVLCGTGL